MVSAQGVVCVTTEDGVREREVRYVCALGTVGV